MSVQLSAIARRSSTAAIGGAAFPPCAVQVRTARTGSPLFPVKPAAK